MMKPAQVVAALSALAQSPATLSFHFRTLSHAGLIESKQDGRFIYCTANFTVMNDMVAYLTENCCGGNPVACKPTRQCPNTGHVEIGKYL